MVSKRQAKQINKVLHDLGFFEGKTVYVDDVVTLLPENLSKGAIIKSIDDIAYVERTRYWKNAIVLKVEETLVQREEPPDPLASTRFADKALSYDAMRLKRARIAHESGRYREAQRIAIPHANDPDVETALEMYRHLAEDVFKQAKQSWEACVANTV